MSAVAAPATAAVKYVVDTTLSDVIITERETDTLMRRNADFAAKQGALLVNTQTPQNILKACEDHKTIVDFKLNGVALPLAQTGQMELERMLLCKADLTSLMAENTSYRDEPHPVTGRHKRVFTMDEFELRTKLQAGAGVVPSDEQKEEMLVELIEYVEERLVHAGFEREWFVRIKYEDACTLLGVADISGDDEMELYRRLGPVVFLTHFPDRTQPFWNMAKSADNTFAYKLDVIVCGQETFGTAVRSCDVPQMVADFERVDHGEYARTLFNLFGEERVRAELTEYLGWVSAAVARGDVCRMGGAIGRSRFVRASRILQLL